MSELEAPEGITSEMRARIDEMMDRESARVKANLPSKEEADDFLKKVTLINQQVTDIISGKLTVTDAELLQMKNEKKEDTIARMKKE